MGRDSRQKENVHVSAFQVARPIKLTTVRLLFCTIRKATTVAYIGCRLISKAFVFYYPLKLHFKYSLFKQAAIMFGHLGL